jgi:polysaccharide deacetylase family sporulation protein PdaB
MKKHKIAGRIAVVMTTLVFVLSFVSQPITANGATSKVISRVYTTEKVVALTFDDGSDGTNIPVILKILHDYNVKGTFFLTGKAVLNHPARIKSIVAAGHAIGNHSYSHPYFTKISTTSMKSQLTRTETIIKNLTGKTTKPYFRPPYGAYNTLVLQTVGSIGYTKTIKWNIDTIDWDGRSAYRIYSKVLNNIVPGSIVLMHVGAGAKYTPAALPTIIKGLKAKGYRFVTIPQLLSLTATQTTYVVKAGDTLYAIALKYGTTVQKIAEANHITNVNLIYVGQVLIIPR